MEKIIENVYFINIKWAIITPILLIIIDILTELVIAWRNDKFNSSIMKKEISKKFGEIVYILIGILTKFALGTELIFYFLVGYICLMELSSLTKNCDRLGVKTPSKLEEKLNNKMKK